MELPAVSGVLGIVAGGRSTPVRNDPGREIVSYLPPRDTSRPGHYPSIPSTFPTAIADRAMATVS